MLKTFTDSQFHYALLIWSSIKNYIFQMQKSRQKQESHLPVKWIQQKLAWRFLVTEIFRSACKGNPESMRSTLVIKTYNIISGETPFCGCHLQSVQCTQWIPCILMVHLFGISFLILLDLVYQYLWLVTGKGTKRENAVKCVFYLDVM